MVDRPNYSLAILNLRPHYRTHKVLQIFFSATFVNGVLTR